jgi:hypothetical protein
MITSPETTNGLSTRVQIVSLSIGPHTYVALAAGIGILKEKHKPVMIRASRIASDLYDLFILTRPYGISLCINLCRVFV